MIKNIGKHFKTICIHKYYVFKYCKAAGIPWRGIKHDLSKFSPVEFFESAKYYQGTSSPIDACKKENGYSLAWQHHKGRNTHHYEYFVDNLDLGGVALQMPFEDALELICDYLGAGEAYMKKNFTYANEYDWWLKKSSLPLLMHPQTKIFIDLTLRSLKESNQPNQILKNSNMKKIYKIAEEKMLDKSSQSSN